MPPFGVRQTQLTGGNNSKHLACHTLFVFLQVQSATALDAKNQLFLIIPRRPGPKPMMVPTTLFGPTVSFDCRPICPAEPHCATKALDRHPHALLCVNMQAFVLEANFGPLFGRGYIIDWFIFSFESSELSLVF